MGFFQIYANPHARKLGANAVVGIRYDTGPMVGAAEVLCYGTAAVVELSDSKAVS